MSLYLPNLPLLLPSSRGPLRLAFHYFLFFRSSNTFYLLYRSKHSTLSSSSPLPPRFIDRIVIDYPYLLYAGLHPGVISSIVVVLALTRRRYIDTCRHSIVVLLSRPTERQPLPSSSPCSPSTVRDSVLIAQGTSRLERELL